MPGRLTTRMAPCGSPTLCHKRFTQRDGGTGFLESARRGGSEKSSFARYLVGKNDHFQS